MKILIFCPTAPRLEPEALKAIFEAEGEHDFFFTRVNPYARGEDDRHRGKNIQYNFEKMRMLVLSAYHKVWIVESDIIPPPGALQKLLEVDAPIVSGLYALRNSFVPVPNVHKWTEGQTVRDGPIPWPEIQKHWGETVRTSGTCTGCVVIDRNVLEDFSFMLPNGDMRPPDGPLMEHCVERGIRQMARLDVVCGHKRPNGEVIWPEKELDYRIETT